MGRHTPIALAAASVAAAALASINSTCRAHAALCESRGAPGAALDTSTRSAAQEIAIARLSRAQLEVLKRDPAALEVRLIDDTRHALFPVPMAGSLRIDGRVARFRPSYPLVEGATYAVSVGQHAAPTMLVRVPAISHPAPRVESVYPTSDTVPENILKFYVRFSTPMRHGIAATHVALLDQSGHLVRAFLRSDAELWDHGDSTLTMFFDPARVKTGLLANTRFGRAVRAGHRYQLVVLRGWPSAQGVPLARSVIKEFVVAAEDRARLDERVWKVTAPGAGTMSPLAVTFGEPLDRLLLDESLTVVDARGAPVGGTEVVANDERGWRFVPDRSWSAGQYAIEIDPALEDLAGNDLVESFDRPPSQHPRIRSRARILVDVRVR